jgi:hypothetical protein
MTWAAVFNAQDLQRLLPQRTVCWIRCEGCLRRCWRTIVRRSRGISTSLRATGRQLPKWRLQGVCDYIEAHRADGLSLLELAGVAHQSHKNRCMYRLSGVNPGQLVALYRK